MLDLAHTISHSKCARVPPEIARIRCIRKTARAESGCLISRLGQATRKETPCGLGQEVMHRLSKVLCTFRVRRNTPNSRTSVASRVFLMFVLCCVARTPACSHLGREVVLAGPLCNGEIQINQRTFSIEKVRGQCALCTNINQWRWCHARRQAPGPTPSKPLLSCFL
jgi:hypothetical protein